MNIADYAPQSGRVLKEDSSIINIADYLDGTTIAFHNAAVAPANGAELVLNGYHKTLLVEIYGTSTSRTVTFYVKGPSGTLRAIQGYKLSDATMATSTTGTGELWRFDVRGVTSVIMDLTAVAGGNVSVKGKVVA